MNIGTHLSSALGVLTLAAVGLLAYRQYRTGEQNLSNQEILSQKLTSIEESVSGIKAGLTAFTPILNNIAGDTATTKQQLADLRTELVNKGIDQSIIDRVTLLDDTVNSIEDGVAAAQTHGQTIADSVEDVSAPAETGTGGETPPTETEETPPAEETPPSEPTEPTEPSEPTTEDPALA